MAASQNVPNVEAIKEKLREEVDDFDEEDFDKQHAQYIENYSAVGDESFAAWACAKEQYGVTVDSDYASSDSGDDYSGSSDAPLLKIAQTKDPERRPTPTTADEDSENFKIEGYITSMWSGRKDGNPRRNFTIRDDTGSLWCMASGEENVENFDSADLQVGDYIQIDNLQLFVPDDQLNGVPDDDEQFQLGMLGQYTDYESEEPDWDLDSVAKNYFDEVVNENEFVVADGIITDVSMGSYVGCATCKSGKYDPDEDPRCPNCAGVGTTEYKPGTVTVKDKGSSSTVKCSIAPGVPLNVNEDVELCMAKFYGEFDTRTNDDGNEFKEINVENYAITLDDDSVITIQDTDNVEDESSSEDSSSDDTSEVSEETTEESSDGSPDETQDDEQNESTGIEDERMEELVLAFEDQVENVGYEIPSTSPLKIIRDQHGADDEEIEEVFEHVKQRGRVTVDGREGAFEEHDWKQIHVGPKDN